MRSVQAGAPADLSFRNASTQSRRLYWLDASGGRKFIALIQPGTMFRQATTAGHAWVVTDEAEKCIHAVTVAESATIDVGGSQTAELAAPAPGMSQPIEPPAPGAGSAPLATSRPVAAEQQAAAQTVDLPTVSPIEQLQLSGNYRLASRADETRALNNRAAGKPEVARIKPELESGQWSFEPVAGTPFVRIRNLWKKTYLADLRQYDSRHYVAGFPGSGQRLCDAQPR